MVEGFLPEDVHFAAQQPLVCTQRVKVHQNVAELVSTVASSEKAAACHMSAHVAEELLGQVW